MITENISIMELITLTLLLLGIGFTGKSLSLVVEDLQRLRKKKDFTKNGARHRLAKRNVRAEAVKFGSMLLFIIAIGFLMTVPTPPRSDGYTIPRLMVIVAILNMVLMMVLDTALYLRDRSVILDLIEEEDRAKAEALATAAEATVIAAEATIEAAVATVAASTSEEAVATAEAAVLTYEAAEEVATAVQIDSGTR